MAIWVGKVDLANSCLLHESQQAVVVGGDMGYAMTIVRHDKVALQAQKHLHRTLVKLGWGGEDEEKNEDEVKKKEKEIRSRHV